MKQQPTVPVGFDYAKALLSIRRRCTYDQIAEFCGYQSANAIYKIINGTVPAHPQGEAIFVLYRQLFGTKPPMDSGQARGEYEFTESERPAEKKGL